MSIGTAAIYSVLGICVVFAALAMLMVIIIILYNATNKKAAQPAPAEPVRAAAPAAEPVLAAGTAGDVKLYDTDPRDAAMVMAILADQLGKPLNELRFISVKRIDDKDE